MARCIYTISATHALALCLLGNNGCGPCRRSPELFVDWDFTTDVLALDDWQVRLRLSQDGETVHESLHPRRAPSEVIYQIAVVKSALEQAALQYLWWEAQQHGTADDTAREVRDTLKLIAKIL